MAEREVVLYCDLHGHSRKHNVFIYGCDSMDDTQNRLRSRIFPIMLSKNAPSMFSYKSSRFGVHKSKVEISPLSLSLSHTLSLFSLSLFSLSHTLTLLSLSITLLSISLFSLSLPPSLFSLSLTLLSLPPPSAHTPRREQAVW